MNLRRVEHTFENGIELKWCSKHASGVGAYVPLENFSKSSRTWDKVFCYCKDCDKKYRLLRSDQRALWRENKREENRKVGNAYYQKNKEERRQYAKEYKEKNSEKVKQYSRNYTKTHLQQYREYSKKRLQKITNRLNSRISTAIGSCLRTAKAGQHWENLVEYNIQTLMAHLESLWEPWMTWENYGKGKGKWVIDHIKPVAAFNFTSYNDTEFKECWALTNLRPLSWEDNSKKSSFYNGIKY